MSLIATAVKHMMAAGITGEALLNAIAEMEEQIRAEPKPRSSSAIRMQRKREKDRHIASQASHVTESDVCDAVAEAAPSLSLLPNENNSNPSTHTHPERTPRTCDARDGGSELTDTAPGDNAGGTQTEPASYVELHVGDAPQVSAKPATKRQRSRRLASDGHPLPADWKPILTPAAEAIVVKWPPGMLDREQLAFESHAASTGRTAKDWQAAFRTWLINADKRRDEDAARRTNGRNSPASHHGADHRDGFTRALDRQIFGDGYTPH